MASPTILCLTAISLQTGKATVFCNKPVGPSNQYNVLRIDNRDQLKAALLASGSQAGFLPRYVS